MSGSMTTILFTTCRMTMCGPSFWHFSSSIWCTIGFTELRMVNWLVELFRFNEFVFHCFILRGEFILGCTPNPPQLGRIQFKHSPATVDLPEIHQLVLLSATSLFCQAVCLHSAHSPEFDLSVLDTHWSEFYLYRNHFLTLLFLYLKPSFYFVRLLIV